MKLIAGTLLLVTAALLNACQSVGHLIDDTADQLLGDALADRMDPEEAGYEYYLGDVHGEAMRASRDLVVDLGDVDAFLQLGLDGQAEQKRESAEAMAASLRSLETARGEDAAHFLPPAALANAHLLLGQLLDQATAVDDARVLAPLGREYHRARLAWSSTVAQRAEEDRSAAQWNLVYRPEILPVSYNITQAAFHVDASLGTPIGDFELVRDSPAGVELLIVESGGRVRAFRLHQGFRLFVPTRYGVELSVPEDRVMRVLVLPPPDTRQLAPR